jgi:hypothetical protein
MYAKPLLVLALPLGVLGALNGHCDKSIAKGEYKTRGICIRTTTCKKYKGTTQTGACPYDPDDVKCCKIDECDTIPDGLGGPFSGCDWTANGCPTAGSWLKSKFRGST